MMMMMMMMRSTMAIITVCVVLICLRFSDAASGKRYKMGDPVPFYANTIGPYRNPSETFPYFDLPFCFSENATSKKETLGEILHGDRLVDSPYKLQFGVDHKHQLLCKKRLTKEDVAHFKSVISDDYYFEMYLDDLPIWGFVGYAESHWGSDPRAVSRYLLHRHFNLKILYNNDHVIMVNATLEKMEDITEDREIEVEFWYSVKWKETSRPFDRRMEIYIDNHHEIEWFSTVSSCYMVLLLTGLLATILIWVLKRDLSNYANDMEVGDEQDESGWKYIHGDVFRFPENKLLLSACVGSGAQLLALTFITFISALFVGSSPYNRGAPLTAILVIYALTSVIAGYISTSFYFQLEGTNWVNNILLSGCVFTLPAFMTFCFLNTIAMAHGATAAVPFRTTAILILVWILVSFPLNILGGIAGKSRNNEFQAPCRTAKCPREIPLQPWYRRTIPQMTMAGFLPFSAICFELNYIFGSLWAYKVYSSYTILFIIFIILLVVTTFVTVALTYFQLAAEDHRWWWRSFLCGGSTGFYVYGYSYYYFTQTHMSGFMQTSFFFGHMACISYGLFLMLGSVGFYASLSFVRRIYGSIKCE